jgi:hypothetical protein
MSIRNKGDAIDVGQPFEMFGVGEVGVSDDDCVDIEMGKISDAFVHCAIESASWLPQDIGAETSCPFGNCGVVTDDPNVKW